MLSTMGLLIHLLVIVMIVKSQADTCSKVDELKVIFSINLNKVNTVLRDTKHQVEELNGTVSGNQEMVTSEVRGIRRQLEELQDSVSALEELLQGSTLPKDCSGILLRGVTTSGVYTVQPLDSGEAFQVYCDMETDGGGWTVFQRRQDGSVDFYLDFANYSRGFGDLEGEFWLGNDNLHRLTAQGEYELRVDLSDFESRKAYAVYALFSISDVSDNYRLTVGNYSGTAGDALAYHNNQPFTTNDRDNDDPVYNCAESYHGAWWYKSCFRANLNGRYFNEATINMQGIKWSGFSSYHSLKTTEMKIRNKV